jgi:hypothetical protein
MRALLAALALAVLGASACGPDNLKACNDFKTAVSCGTDDPTQSPQVDCTQYRLDLCDLKPYFDCLRPYFACTDGSYDKAKIGQGESDCATHLACKM